MDHGIVDATGPVMICSAVWGIVVGACAGWSLVIPLAAYHTSFRMVREEPTPLIGLDSGPLMLTFGHVNFKTFRHVDFKGRISWPSVAQTDLFS